MHEASIVCGLISLLEAQAESHGVKRINRVIVKAGQLRSIEPRALIGCFEAFSEGTVAEGAELVVESIPVRARCEDCHSEFEVKRYRFLCPFCHGTNLTITSGEELYVDSFDAEDDKPDGRPVTKGD